MSLRTAIVAATAVLGLALLGVWLTKPAALIDAQRFLDRETLELLVVRSGLWGPILIIGLMAVAVVRQPDPQRADRAGGWGGLRAFLGNRASRDRRRAWGADRVRPGTCDGA